jgi:hypothetical protein
MLKLIKMLKYINIIPYGFTGYIIGGLTYSLIRYMSTPSKKMYEYIHTDIINEEEYNNRYKHYDASEDENYKNHFDHHYSNYLNLGSIIGFFFGIYYYKKIE